MRQNLEEEASHISRRRGIGLAAHDVRREIDTHEVAIDVAADAGGVLGVHGDDVGADVEEGVRFLAVDPVGGNTFGDMEVGPIVPLAGTVARFVLEMNCEVMLRGQGNLQVSRVVEGGHVALIAIGPQLEKEGGCAVLEEEDGTPVTDCRVNNSTPLYLWARKKELTIEGCFLGYQDIAHTASRQLHPDRRVHR